MATVAAVIASTHHPFYYRASTATGAERAAVRRRVGGQDRGVPRDADPRRARRAGDGRQRPLPPAVAGQHAAVPGRQGAVLRRQLVQRGARVRPAADARCAGDEELSGAHPARRPRRAASTWRSATSCGSTTASPARSSRCGRRPTCRSCRSTPTSSRRRCRSRSGSSQLGRAIREMVESWPSDKRVAIIGTGHLSLELGGPRQFGQHGPDPEFDRKAVEWIANGDIEGCLRRGDARQPARARATPPTASWTSC